ncbi:sigma-70 family RNA polymerase sigma factor [Fredinandcohnia sp. 179-A 10B2 NHS]|uniref:sigma-70 family RNA polymerase sigma factor n=1 Tax=Fredinandcohnia sp. 179-A 10B2 NHS TaxID=3235176 RepID=UPI0039A10764
MKPLEHLEEDFLNIDRDIWLEYIMNTYGLSLKKLAYTYLKDWQKAEDVVQDVFITCYTKIDSFRGECSLKTWIYRITINKCKDNLKSSAFKTGFLDSFLLSKLISKDKNPEEAVLQGSEMDTLSSHVLQLPVKYREVVILRYFDELSVPEISQLLVLNQNTIRTRLKRARLLLKKALERIDENGR